MAQPKPERGDYRRLKAKAGRMAAKADKSVYEAVDKRDGLRCRACGEYGGYDIQRHHIILRSRGGETTTENVISLCVTCHMVGLHGGHLGLSGNADVRHGVQLEYRDGRVTEFI